MKKFCPASRSNTVFEFPEASVNEMQTRGKKSENAWCEEDAVTKKKRKGPSKRYFVQKEKYCVQISVQATRLISTHFILCSEVHVETCE